MMEAQQVYKVVTKLIGGIEPVGATHIDKERYDNLKEMCELIDYLIADVRSVSRDENRQEYSMKRAGEYAAKFINQQKNQS